ncbi:MAG: hypothetical protein ACXW1D_00430 [Halobacteriota archaeon]
MHNQHTLNKHRKKHIMSQRENHGQDEAKAQANSIIRMVAALECDYERLEELQEMNRGDGLRIHEQEELAQLEIDANGNASDDRAREAITEDALDVQVRAGWHSPGEEVEADEFMILLCTGGPAVRIMGELDEYMQPCRAWIEHQDWSTPWTMLDSEYIDQATLLTYCRQFYFGE